MKKLVYMKKREEVQTIKPGTYNAVITAFETTADYMFFEDIILFFDIYDGTNVIKHWECLQFNNMSKRVEKLRKMVRGLDGLSLSILVGIEVTLDFEQEYSTDRKYCDRSICTWKAGKKKRFYRS